MRRGIGRLRAGGSGGFNPASSGLSLTWFDASDFSSEFQDSTAATPVTAVTQPVGLMLDKGLGLARGANQVVNGDFSSSTGWTAQAGWSIAGGKGTASAAAAGTFLFRTTGFTIPPNSLVFYSATVSNYIAGSVKAYAWNGTDLYVNSQTIAANGTFTGYFVTKTTAIAEIGFTPVVGPFSADVDDLQYFIVSGNYMVQATAGSRPLEQTQGGFLSTKSDGLDDYLASFNGGGGTAGFFYCAAINPSAIGANQTLWADTGTNTGYRVRLNATNQLELAAGNGTAFTTAATVATVTTGTTYVVMAWHDGVNLSVQINSNAVASTAFGTTTAGTAAFTDAASNGGASGFFNGYLFNRIYKKDSALTSAQRTQVQQFIANSAGVTL